VLEWLSPRGRIEVDHSTNDLLIAGMPADRSERRVHVDSTTQAQPAGPTRWVGVKTGWLVMGTTHGSIMVHIFGLGGW